MAECTVKTFRDTMVSWWKKSPKTVDWANEYSPIVDVTDTVKQVLNLPSGVKVYLTIYGDDLSKIRVIKVGKVAPILYPDGRPADPNVYGVEAYKSAVANWLIGQEWERQTCEEETYWVIFPCQLAVPKEEEEKLDIWPIILAGAGAFVFGMMLAGGRRE